MPSPYSISHGAIALHKITTVGNAVDVVSFDRACPIVRIISNMADDLYVTVDGSTPTVGGSNCHRIPAGSGIGVLDLEDFGSDVTVVRLISATPVIYSIEGAL